MRNICVASGTRADYGHLFWLMKEIQEDPELTLQTLVTGSHLSDRFGLTVQNFKVDGFSVDAQADSQLVDDSPVGICQSLAATHGGAAQELEKLKPDIVVVLGDRYEMLAVTMAAHILRIPVAHIHGGESTEGVIDEAIRHSITKFSNLHFVAAETYKNVVIQLGENPETVFNFGAPGLDHLCRTPLYSSAELSGILEFNLDRPYCVVVYHPETLSEQNQTDQVGQLIHILLKEIDFPLLISKSNGDPGGQKINEKIEELAQAYPTRIKAFTSLGQKGFFSLLENSEFIIGNSSSGIIEAPALGVVSINVGDRQKGRLSAPSVIQCALNEKDIQNALSLVKSKKGSVSGQSLYAGGTASGKIKDILKKYNLNNILVKKFYTQEFP